MKTIRYLSLALMVFTAMACNNKGKLPTVVTGKYTTYPTTKTVQCEGYVETDGGEVVVDRGICYAAGSVTPTVGDNRVSAGSGKGSFSAVLQNITQGTYSYRAFATNSAGTAYGAVSTFTMSSSSTSGGGESGGGSGGSGGSGGQTEDGFITIAEAIAIANALPDFTKTTVNYKVRAVISELITDPSLVPGKYTNMHLKLKDATGEIGSYYTNYLGNKPFTSANQVPSVGDEVVVEGPLYRYVSGTTYNPEFLNAWFVSVNGKTEDSGSGSGGSSEPQGNYVSVNGSITTIASASCLLIYRYAVNPAFQSDLTLYFYDASGNIVFYIANNSLSSVSSITTGTWTYLSTRTYSTDTYYAWGSTTFGSRYNYKALTSFVITQNGNDYIVDCVIDSTTKLHYEGPIPITTRTDS